jgi:site-specific DNA recombinase
MRAILYARVSTREQADHGYSLSQQLGALRDYCKEQGYQIVEEVSDPGYSGSSPNRPGLDRVRDLVAAGGVDVVLAQDRDRIAREPTIIGWLEYQFADHGCQLRALNDPEEGDHTAELTKNILDSIAKFERVNTRQRSIRNTREKLRTGKVVGSGSPPYGYQYNEDRTNYEIDHETMPTVHLIFDMMANGGTINGVTSTLNSEGVSTPGKQVVGERWYPTTVRRMILADTYRPHNYQELEVLVTPEVLATLNADCSYGVWWYGRTKSTKGKKKNKDGTVRKNASDKPRASSEDRIAVPIPDAGITLETVEAARSAIANNYKARSDAKYFYELRGMVYCGECGVKFNPRHTTRHGKDYRYYRCQKGAKWGHDVCGGRPRRADYLEDEVALYVGNLIDDPTRLQAQLDAAIAQESSRNPDEDVTSWLRVVEKCDRERAKYQDMYVADLMSLDELRQKIAELDETRTTAEEHLANARAGQNRVEELRATKKAMLEAYTAGIAYDGIYSFPAEMRHEIYQALGLKVTVDEDSLTYELDINANVVRLTREVESYAAEVEAYRGKLRCTSRADGEERERARVSTSSVTSMGS